MQVNFPNDKKLVGGGTVDDNEEEEMEEDEELDDDLIIKSAKLSDFTFAEIYDFNISFII